MTLAVAVATGLAAGRVRLAKYRRWRSAPVMARVRIGGRPMRSLERFVSDEMIYAGFWRFPSADIRRPGQRLTGATAVLGLMVRGVGSQGLARWRDHVELPPIKPVTTRINLHRANCRCCGNTITAEPPADRQAARLPLRSRHRTPESSRRLPRWGPKVFAVQAGHCPSLRSNAEARRDCQSIRDRTQGVICDMRAVVRTWGCPKDALTPS
jgi:hypothetical protein